jgi:hypothetical protein
MRDEVARIQSVMGDMGADMVAVVPAGPKLMGATLRQALEGGSTDYEQVGRPAGRLHGGRVVAWAGACSTCKHARGPNRRRPIYPPSQRMHARSPPSASAALSS